MDRFQPLFQKILTLLRIRPVAGGLEISDDALRLAFFDGKLWQLQAIRLEPGVLENGKIKDQEKFDAALIALKAGSKISGGNKKKKINVVVSLSSVNVYTQVFSLPVLSGEALEKAVELNLQMASPSEASKTYTGWEVVGKEESQSQLDVLSAFIDRSAVDEMVQVLLTAGFLTMAVEPRSIALTRILRERGSGIDAQKAYLLLDIDDVGIDFLVIRHGLPYFEYTHSWKDVADEHGEISMAKFEGELTASLHQVTNFYGQHWTEPIAGVIIAAAALHEVIEETVASATTFPAVRLSLEMGQPISSEWLTAVGGSLRDTTRPKLGEGEISLLGPTWTDRFQEEQLFHFIQFWRVFVPAVFGVMVLLLWGTEIFLGRTGTAPGVATGFQANPSQTAEIATLEASTTAFNDFVTMVRAAENSGSKNYAVLQKLEALTAPDSIVINTLSSPGAGVPIILSGSAPSDDRILAFKTALQNAPGFSAVNLPITDIQNNGGTYTFQVTFVYAP